jgi:outer membrane receptor for ferrienterochelin and colicins
MNLKSILLLAACVIAPAWSLSQGAYIAGQVEDESGQPLAWAQISAGGGKGSFSDSAGRFFLGPFAPGSHSLSFRHVLHVPEQRTVALQAGDTARLRIALRPLHAQLDAVVISGSMKAVRRLESAVPVQVFQPAFFRKNPVPNLFESLQNVNGVRPQINCSICNTGDIHIQGLEGPYTLVLLDGMPMVSGLGSVYGLMGIPQSLIGQLELVKGPASTLYGSEAVGGLINVITRAPEQAPRFAADLMGSGWQEYSADLGTAWQAGKVRGLTGLHLFSYQQPRDDNGDGLTDLALQERFSLFQKFSFERPQGRQASLAGRYYHEDRWGGQLNWAPAFRGGDSIYGESIYTRRWELMGQWQAPLREKVMLSFSATSHDQNSVYGTTPYLALQRVLWGQAVWEKRRGRHSWLAGATLRHTYYDDNSPATLRPESVWLPGLFVEDELRWGKSGSLLAGLRYDRDPRHGGILTPRLAFRQLLGDGSTLRLAAGSGYRVVSLFTEDHAALSGARQVVIEEALRPERSWHLGLHWQRSWTREWVYLNLESSLFLTRFSNQILPDYDSDPSEIRYANLEGHASYPGASVEAEASFRFPLQVRAGLTLLDPWLLSPDEAGRTTRSRPVLTERFSGTWGLSYQVLRLGLSLDYTGNVYGPMRLPLAGPLDPRPGESPWWSIQNLQLSWKAGSHWELYGGIKNLLDFTPRPDAIARAFDPFDTQVQYDAEGNILATPDNPYALSFDPSYVFAPNQGRRFFIGLRYQLSGKRQGQAQKN